MADDLHGLLAAHAARPAQCVLTMLTFCTDQPHSCGIVVTDDQCVVTGFFHEKVADPPGTCANGALYVFDPPFLDSLAGMIPQPT